MLLGKCFGHAARDREVELRPGDGAEHDLGTPGCQAFALRGFLRRTESDYLYLVGDIVDGWQLKRRWYWHQTHNDVIQKLLRKARKGTQVIYIPGNHDEAARHMAGVASGGIAIVDEAVHVTADGRRVRVTHGDLFDAALNTPPLPTDAHPCAS